MSFLRLAVTSPLLFYQTVNRMVYPGTDLVLAQICTETFPTQLHKHGFTFVILAVQYVMPLVVLPIVHANILLFLRYFAYLSLASYYFRVQYKPLQGAH